MKLLRDMLTGQKLLTLWLVPIVVCGLIATITSGFLKTRKIQPNGFKWKTFSNEVVIAMVTLAFSAAILGWLQKYLTAHGFIKFTAEPTHWWIIALEYAAYFFLFDTWFYWLHRLMHVEPIYRWVHKLHHKSTAPNPLTSLSETPIEAFINGAFVPFFVSVFTIHVTTMAMIVPTAVIMGFYVHSGYEFFPRWWNASWATKWFITVTFHDQHHRYFTGNFGGYTTIWDRVCGTMRPKFEGDFDKFQARIVTSLHP